MTRTPKRLAYGNVSSFGNTSYTVPAGKTALIKSIAISADVSTSAVLFAVKTERSSVSYYLINDTLMYGSSTVVYEDVDLDLEAGDKIKVEPVGITTGTGVAITCIIGGYEYS